MESHRSFGGPPFRSRRTLWRVVEDKATLSLLASVKSQWDRQVKVEYQLLLAKELGFLANQEYNALNARLVEIKRMLNALIQKLRG